MLHDYATVLARGQINETKLLRQYLNTKGLKLEMSFHIDVSDIICRLL